MEKQVCQDQAARWAQAEEVRAGWRQSRVSSMQLRTGCFPNLVWELTTKLSSPQRWWVRKWGCCLQETGGFQRFMPLVLFWVFRHSSQIHKITNYQNYTWVNSDNMVLTICLDSCSSTDPKHLPSNATYNSASHSNHNTQRVKGFPALFPGSAGMPLLISTLAQNALQWKIFKPVTQRTQDTHSSLRW